MNYVQDLILQPAKHALVVDNMPYNQETAEEHLCRQLRELHEHGCTHFHYEGDPQKRGLAATLVVSEAEVGGCLVVSSWTVLGNTPNKAAGFYLDAHNNHTQVSIVNPPANDFEQRAQRIATENEWQIY